MTPKELLGPRDDVSDNYGGTEWEENVLIVGVQDQSTVHLACTRREIVSLYMKSLYFNLPWNPMTAERSSSCSIVSFCCP